MTISTVTDLIRSHPLLGDLEPPDLEQVAGCGHNARFNEGQRLLVEGAQADYFYLLRKGRVALEISAPGRGTIVVETLGPGDILGWSWLLPPFRWHFDARAIEPVAAIRFDGACLRGKLSRDPRLGYELFRRFTVIIVDRLQATRVRLLDLYGDGDGNVRR